MEAGGSKDKFMALLDKKIHEAKDMLIERFNYICSQSPASAKFMYENGTMAGYKPEEGIRSALKHGTLVIGQLGLAEALEIIIGTDHTTPEGMAVAKEIEALFNKRCVEFKKALSLNFGVYYTPAESLCYTAFKKWREKYGDRENVTYYIDKNGNRHDKLYFTNSIHVPVYKEMSPFKKIDIESELTPYSNAGCITYAEVLHDAIHNTEALEELVHYAMAKDIPYFAINSSNDLCESCGYQGAITDRCPKCGSENVSRLKRVTGYLTGSYRDAFNPGKVVETDQRVVHNETPDFTKKQ
jgi:ribonucleoside-triphosphate reductase